jgi:hypothetical protein
MRIFHRKALGRGGKAGVCQKSNRKIIRQAWNILFISTRQFLEKADNAPSDRKTPNVFAGKH